MPKEKGIFDRLIQRYIERKPSNQISGKSRCIGCSEDVARWASVSRPDGELPSVLEVLAYWFGRCQEIHKNRPLSKTMLRFGGIAMLGLLTTVGSKPGDFVESGCNPNTLCKPKPFGGDCYTEVIHDRDHGDPPSLWDQCGCTDCGEI